VKKKKKKITELLIEIDNHKLTISQLESQVREDENLRKKLHNTIQELKGNIRVFCRVRPFIGEEIKEFGEFPTHFEFQPNNDRIIDISTEKISGINGKTDNKKFNFTFDKVFPPSIGQAKVFEEISQLVQSALDGYNTCIFAYGQTGSGKTYTMEGPGIQTELEMPFVDNEQRGMIPRAVEQIFETAKILKDKGWEYEMEAMFLEIYNEQINDLLSTKKHQEDVKFEIKHDNKGNTTVSNLTYIKVRNPSQVYELLKRASKNRAVASTNMNERSSRSHSVFQLKLHGLNKVTNEEVNGNLNLIDLAGSERLNQSGATGQRLTETQHINKSLTHLGDVIAALANKSSHIPYRNSKLTYLLQNSLGGNSKTLMFVNISPRISDLNETISSLRFATKVNNCEIGTAKKQAKIDFNK
jgi:kinesin family protein C1